MRGSISASSTKTNRDVRSQARYYYGSLIPQCSQSSCADVDDPDCRKRGESLSPKTPNGRAEGVGDKYWHHCRRNLKHLRYFVCSYLWDINNKAWYGDEHISICEEEGFGTLLSDNIGPIRGVKSAK